jgi:hypothetical protein
MSAPTYTFMFTRSVPLDEVAGTLRLSVLAAEGLHGEALVGLDASHRLDPGSRTCTIAAGTEVGRDLAKLFEIFIRREFGPAAFRVVRAEPGRRARSA